jgi:gamma-glutamylcyclotransferase (GGCT)/AIG2-like uncharacterized protein YtfP
MDKLVAVYGTLRQGFGNNCVLGDSEKLGLTALAPEWEMFSLGGFPGVRQGDKSVLVEVYRVTEESIAQSLDWLEGFREQDADFNFYNKATISTKFGDAEMYILEGAEYDGHELIGCGDWHEHIRGEAR